MNEEVTSIMGVDHAFVPSTIVSLDGAAGLGASSEALRGYVISNHEQVSAFLSAHPEYVPALVQLHNSFGPYFRREGFGPPALHVFREPDEEGAGLIVRIRSTLAPREALRVLEQFEDDYLLIDQGRARFDGLDLTVGLDYV